MSVPLWTVRIADLCQWEALFNVSREFTANLGELIETSVSLTSPWKLMLLIPWLGIDAAGPQGKCLTEVSNLNFFTVVEIGNGPGNFQYSVVRTY